MISTQKIYEDLREEISPQAALKIADAMNLVYMEILDTVRKDDLTEFKGIMSDLAEAQKRTEQRVEELTEEQIKTAAQVNLLAEEQKKTSVQVRELTVEMKETKQEVSRLDKVMQELAEAQKRTEQRVEELAEEQKKTSVQVNLLAEEQKKTSVQVNLLAEEQKKTSVQVRELTVEMKETKQEVSRLDKVMQELAEAQKRTENSLNKLIKKVDVIEERQEGISNSVGYLLEDRSYISLPKMLEKDGITIKGRLIRRYYEDNQINIFGRAVRHDGRDVLILGEAKTRPSKIEVDRFLKIVERIKIYEKTEDVLTVFVAYDFHPKTEEYIKSKGIRYFWSYELDHLSTAVH